MNKIFFLPVIFFLNCSLFFAQENKPVPKGFITIMTNQKYQFTNLRYEGDQVIFNNVATKANVTYFINSIKLIEDEEKTILYAAKIPEQKADLSENATKPLVNDILFRPNYPEGIYKTKEDFINKKVNPLKIIPKGLIGFEKPYLDKIEHNCYFYYDSSDRKIKNVFAVSYEGHLYFQLNAILSNRNKTDRAQTNDFPNGFVRVILGGDNYFYTEADLANLWAQGFAYGGVGGVAGSVLARNVIHGKGIVWDFKKQEFNIFKNCNDYNDFIKDIYPTGVQECLNQQPDVLQIRKVIEKIK